MKTLGSYFPHFARPSASFSAVDRENLGTTVYIESRI